MLHVYSIGNNVPFLSGAEFYLNCAHENTSLAPIEKCALTCTACMYFMSSLSVPLKQPILKIIDSIAF